MGKFLRDSRGNLVAIDGGLVLERILDRKPRDCESCGFSKWVKKDKVFIIQGGSGITTTTTTTTTTRPNAAATTTTTTTPTATDAPAAGSSHTTDTNNNLLHTSGCSNTSGPSVPSSNDDSYSNGSASNVHTDQRAHMNENGVLGGYVGGGSMEWICPDCAIKRGLPVEFYHKNFYAPTNDDIRRQKSDAVRNSQHQQNNANTRNRGALDKILDITGSLCSFIR